jgi:uncharacterized alpha-E superfamily protein
MYWMSRYLERAEHMVRVLDVNMSLMLDRSSVSTETRWQRVLAFFGNPKGVTWNGSTEDLLHQLAFGDEEHLSIKSCVILARENASQVRDELSSEQWQQLNRMYLEVTRERAVRDVDTTFTEFLQPVLAGVHMFQGLSESTMNHGEGWHFIQIGRYLERASATATLLNVFHHRVFSAGEEDTEGNHYLEWIGLLRCCTAFEAYCNVYTADVTEDRILEFLLLNRDFPHSIRYSIDVLQRALGATEQATGGRAANQLTRVAGKLQSSLSFVDIGEIIHADVGQYLSDILQGCQTIHELVYKIYIHYSVQSALGM